MARKSIKGYAEKNYYDNTRFSGGIVATNDPLNEGYFKHLVNFDISDTGQSLIPRKGFLTTTFKKDTEILSLKSEKTIYFYDESLGKYIFFDTSSKDADGKYNKAYKCNFETTLDENNFFTDIETIDNIDITSIKDKYGGYGITTIYNNLAIRIKDEYNITSYFVKVEFFRRAPNNRKYYKYTWLKLYYRENEITDADYVGIREGNTLVIEEVDTDQVVNYVDTNYRNLAYAGSIIPDPIQAFYTDDVPMDHYDRIPMLYVKDSKGKYLINDISFSDLTNNGFDIVPNFYIAQDINRKYNWAFTYEIFSTSYRDTMNDSEKVVYKAPIYYYKDEMKVAINDTICTYNQYISKNKWKKYISTNTDTVEIYNSGISLDTYNEYITALSFDSSIYILPEYVIYITPASPEIDYSIKSSIKSTTSSSHLFGPYGLHTHFSNSLARYATKQDEESMSTREIPAAKAHNIQAESGTLLSDTYFNKASMQYSIDSSDLDTMLDDIEDLGLCIYVKQINNLKSIKEGTGGFQDCCETVLSSTIYSWDTAPMTVSEFKNSKEYEAVKNACVVYARILPYCSKISVKYEDVQEDLESNKVLAERLFPKVLTNTSGTNTYWWTYDIHNIVRTNNNYYKFNDISTGYKAPSTFVAFTNDEEDALNQFLGNISFNPYYSLFYCDTANNNYYTSSVLLDVYSPFMVFNKLESGKLFMNIQGTLTGRCNSSNYIYTQLKDKGFFDQGINITLYFLKITETSIDPESSLQRDSILARSGKIYNSRYLNATNMTPSTYIEYLKEDPELIKHAKGIITYDSPLGNHLVVYTKNKLYISQQGQHYYFYNLNKFEYPEPIVKVLQYKEILLVFTRQNLYAIHLEEVVQDVANGTNEDGTIKYTQQISYEFRSHVVLYNLMVNEKYADAIQVYNQMVLFYSADGQMFLIKPTAAITSDTRFSIQYFNKSANDILLNYKDYIQRRLQDYGLDDTVGDVDIKVLANINYIKIFYSTGKITYILVYDVNNNRYFVYDTVAFSNIKYLHYIPSGELYIVSGRGDDTNLYFTVPYTDTNIVDNNVDISYYDYFSPYEINAEIDTGVINLNNHLKKRFKDLHVIYKNLNANNVAFSLETYVDDIPIITYINSTFEVRNVSSFDTLVVVDNNNVVQLIRPEDQLIDNTALFSFIDYTSNKIITHKTNIVSKGKTIRIKMKYRSKGKYKIQGFGLIYKEHTV